MTHVAVVAPRFPPDVGGLEYYAFRTAVALREAGHQVTVISTHPERGTLRGAHAGLPVIRLGTSILISNTPIGWGWFRQLRALFHDLEVDVVNAHAPVPYLADVAVAAAGRRPTILTYHAGSMVKGVGGPVDALLRGYERVVLPRVFARATRLVAVSPIALTAARAEASIIPPGVDTRTFVPVLSDRRDPSILFAGRIETQSRWKGLHVLLEAVPAVAERVPGLTVDVVGDGDLLAEMQELASRLGIAERISWHGRLGHGDLARLMRRAGVTVLPSLTEAESFGMTLVEAMACRCPVVGSRVGGVPFVIRDRVDGLLVPPGDAAALARAIGEVLGDPVLAARLGAAGREAAVDRWDWSHHAQATVAEVAAVVQSAGSSGTATLR